MLSLSERKGGLTMATVLFVAFLLAPSVMAHCDTYDGPVIKEARAALEKGDVTPVLKWVTAEHEAEIRDVFDETLAVRKLGAEAKNLAERFFFETLVRLHREGEGAPYTGLKPSGTPLEPGVEAAETALSEKSDEAIIKGVSAELAAGISERLHHALEKKEHAGHSVEAGREYVAAYIEFIHYVERIHQAIASPAAHHENQSEGSEHKH